MWWLRWLGIWAVAGSIIAALLWIEWSRFPVDTQQNQHAYAEYAAKQANPHPEKTFWERTADDPIAVFNLLLVAFTGVLAVATIGLGIATYKLWRVSERQAGHMERSLAITNTAAEAAQRNADAALFALRPWVSCEASIIGDLTYRDNGDPCIAIRFILENNGHSPAMGVQLLPRFHLLSPAHAHSIQGQQRLADLLKGLPAQDRGLLLFPGDEHIFDIELPISKIEIEKSIEDIKPHRQFFPELIVLVSYTYPLASHSPQTGLIYEVERIVPDEVSGFAFTLDGPDVPADNIRLRAHESWGAYAT